MPLDDELNGCELDFTEDPTRDEEIESLLEGWEARGAGFSSLAAVSGGRDLGLADRLRAAGLTVREVSGWRSRGHATFAGKGAVTHHTAGASTGLAPSLGIIINGRSGLPGPLANTYMDREGTVYVIASGKANHAGTGSWKGAVGNSQMWGLEIEHPGRSPLDFKRIKLAARVQAACIKGTATPSMVCQHWEWDLVANGGEGAKIDVATNLHPGRDPSNDEFRAMVARELKLMETVTEWEVTWVAPNGTRPTDIIKRPRLWAANHPGAFQRGAVIFRPKREEV